MLCEPITYTDFDGNVHENEPFYFNISRPEIADLQFSTPGGLRAHIQRIMKTEDLNEIYSLFKEIVLKSYGVKTPDGKSFVKVDEHGRSLGDLFQYHAAYEVLFEKLISDDESIAAFINEVTPKLSEEERKVAEKQMEEAGFKVVHLENRQTVAPK